MSDLQPEPGASRRQRKAAVNARGNIKVAQREIDKTKAKEARQRKKKRLKREASKSGGEKSIGRSKTNMMEFPGDGRTLNFKIADVAATAQCTMAHDAHDAFKSGSDAAILALIQGLGSGSDKKELQQMVMALAAENMGSGRTAALYGDFTVKKATGGTMVDGGVVLGKEGDYQGGNGTDGTQARYDVDEEGGLWVASYYDVFGGKRITEPFTLFSKSFVESSIVGAYDAKCYELLQRETFPCCIGLFWSLVHHYRGGGQGRRDLLGLFQAVCNVRDWAVVPGLAKRKGKK